MAARTGRDSFGAAFTAKARRGRRGHPLRSPTTQPSALALAAVDRTGEAHYDFWLAGAADFGWRAAELPQLDAGTTIHLGSLAAFLPPGADTLERWALAHQDRCTISFDPNIRSVAWPRPDSLVRLERLAELANVIRVSAGDLVPRLPAHRPWSPRSAGSNVEPRFVLTHGDPARRPSPPDEVTVAAPAIHDGHHRRRRHRHRRPPGLAGTTAGRLRDQLNRELPPETLRLMLPPHRATPPP